MVISLAFAWNMNEPRAYLGFSLTYAVGFLTVPLVFKFAQSRFEYWAENAKTFVEPTDNIASQDLERWLKNEISFFGGSPPMYVTGLLTAMAAFFTFWLAEYPAVQLNNAASIFTTLLQFASTFVAGLGIYGIFCACRTIWRIGKKFRVRVKTHKFGVMSTGIVLVQCYFAVAISWSIYVLSAILGVEHFEFALLEAKLPLLILVLPTLAALFVSFVVCQTPLHLRMSQFKRDQLEKIETILDGLRPTHDQQFTRDIADKIAFFESRRTEIASLPEWPFGYKAIVANVGSSIAVILPTLISSLVPVVARAAGIGH